MIRVRSLHVYPVKSCRGIDLERAEVVATGFEHDRRWMVVGSDGVFLSQRDHPALARVATRIEPGRLVLETEGRPPLEVPLEPPEFPPRTVRVWNDACSAVSEGPAAAEWFGSLLGRPCELVRQPEDDDRRVDPGYSPEPARVGFADGFPFLLFSQGSLDELHRRLGAPVPADRFRANIVVEGCAPHAEDGWGELSIGGLRFAAVKPCARCVVVTTDQRTGARSAEPLATLASYRSAGGKVLFGQNLVHLDRGVVRVGDPVEPAVDG
ncbi:MAG: MOSC N-terminal beta barrel domain-containing protein [Thermoanaerobaculales bacterium]|nr:MOSC N-terminal beta barrel domain-containing protein [Thermoanaerobaculales bacterium]